MKKVVFTILLVLIGLLLGLVAAETALRVAGISFPKFHTVDDTLGFANNPGARGMFTDEGRGFVEFNSQGLRGPEYSLKKPAGVFRIAVLGDSFTSALQVMREHSFPAIVEKRLSSCPELRGRKIEVINFGVSGYGTAQELILLKERVLKYSPDMVVLAFLSGNDITDNSPALDSSDVPRPYFTLKDGKLVQDNSFQQSEYHTSRRTWKRKAYDYALQRSRIVQVIARVKHLSMQRRRRDLIAAGGAKDKEFLSDDIFSEPRTKEMKDGWEVSERLILEISRVCSASGAGFLLVTATNPGQVKPEKEKPDPDIDLFYPEKRLAGFASENNIEILALARPFKKYASKNKVCLHGFDDNLCIGHWNEKGHALAGDLISQKICATIK